MLLLLLRASPNTNDLLIRIRSFCLEMFSATCENQMCMRTSFDLVRWRVLKPKLTWLMPISPLHLPLTGLPPMYRYPAPSWDLRWAMMPSFALITAWFNLVSLSYQLLSGHLFGQRCLVVCVWPCQSSLSLSRCQLCLGSFWVGVFWHCCFDVILLVVLPKSLGMLSALSSGFIISMVCLMMTLRDFVLHCHGST